MLILVTQCNYFTSLASQIDLKIVNTNDVHNLIIINLNIEIIKK